MPPGDTAPPKSFFSIWRRNCLWVRFGARTGTDETDLEGGPRASAKRSIVPRAAEEAKDAMPTLNVTTNVPVDRVAASDLVGALSKAVAELVGKPEAYVMISLKPDTPMSFGGNEEPCAFGELISIGAIGGEKNKTISAGLSRILEEKLGVPPKRFYLKFFDVERPNFGYNGTTF